MEKTRNPFAIPIAIVVAGAFVALAIFFSNSGKDTNPSNLPGALTPAFKVASQKMDISPIGENDHILGNPSAQVVIVEYSDTECPFCKRFHSTMHSIVDEFGKSGAVAWVYRHFPLDSLHKKARNEAQATECAARLGGNEKFWAYIDRLFEITPSNDNLDPKELPVIAKFAGLNEKTFADCLASGADSQKIENQFQEAVAAGGTGTPFSILIFNKKFDQKKVEEFIIDLALRERLPLELFAISEDNQKISVSGALSVGVIRQLIESIPAF